MSITLGEIAGIIDAELYGDADCRITGVAPLQNAGSGDLTFLANRRYYKYLENTRAAAVILAQRDKDKCPVHALVCDEPYLAYVKALRYLYPQPAFDPFIHPRAVISDTASVDVSAYIGANTVVGNDVRIDNGVFIGPGCIINEGAIIGRGSRLVANVVVCHRVVVGERALIHPGVVLGADGFGLANDGGQWLKIPQLGSVEIGNDVEIGANTTIDRGALENTVIEDGVKIDNQVQIGHNTRVGAHTAIAGCAVIAGSVIIGKRCMIGGASALSGHIEIADDVIITGLSGVPNSIKQAGMYSGGIAVTDNHTWRKNMVRFKHLDELARKVDELERRLDNDEPSD